MARGQSKKSDQQLSMTNNIGTNQQDQANNLESSLIPGYTSMMDTGYLSPADKAAATTSEMGSATAPFQTAKFEANNNAAATHNAAGLTENQDQLALEEGQTAGGAAANLQDQQMQNQEAGMYGLAGQEAGNRQEAASMYGLGPGTLDARAAGQSGDQAITGYGNMAANLIGAYKGGK